MGKEYGECDELATDSSQNTINKNLFLTMLL